MPRSPVSLPLHGGCACGALRYTLTSAPLALLACHCSLCQRQSGSAFGQSLRVTLADLHLDGPSETRLRDTERGTKSQMVFCPNCGGRIYNARPGTPVCHLRGGTLDDTSWLRPAAHLWTSRAQPWVSFGAGTLIYDGQPDDLQPIVSLWQDRFAPEFV